MLKCYQSLDYIPQRNVRLGAHLERRRRFRLWKWLLPDVLRELGPLERPRGSLAVPHKAEAEGRASVLPGDGEAERQGHAEHATRVDLVDGARSPRGVAQLYVSNLRAGGRARAARLARVDACARGSFGSIIASKKTENNF